MCLLGLTLEANLAVDGPACADEGPIGSERVLHAQEDSSVAAVGGSFIEEPGGVGDARFGDAEVARIRQVEEVARN